MYLWQYRFSCWRGTDAEGRYFKRLVQFVKAALWWYACQSGLYHNGGIHVFGAISGSNPATVSAIGGMMCPELKKDGYPDDVAGAIAGASGTLGVIIPPSIPMVVFGIATSVSVTDLFIGVWSPESCWL